MKGGLKIGIELAEHNFYRLHAGFEVQKFRHSAAHPRSFPILRYNIHE